MATDPVRFARSAGSWGPMPCLRDDEGEVLCARARTEAALDGVRNEFPGEWLNDYQQVNGSAADRDGLIGTAEMDFDQAVRPCPCCLRPCWTQNAWRPGPDAW